MDTDLESGDIILLHGTSGCFAKLVEKMSGSIYSHVAMVLRDPVLDDGQVHKGYYIIESGVEDRPDVEDNKFKFGVQVQPLSQAMDNWDGQVFYRRLQCERTDEFYKTLNETHMKVHNKPYDTNLIDWIQVELNRKLRSPNDGAYWCSALVTYFYIQLGLVDPDTDVDLIRPKDFGLRGERLTFINCQLDPEFLLN